MTDPHQYAQHRLANRSAGARPLWQIYVGITGLLLLIVVVLAGGIIWYDSRKSNELAIAAAERLILQVGEKISQRSNWSMIRYMRSLASHPWCPS